MTELPSVVAFAAVLMIAGCTQSGNMQNAKVFETEAGPVFARPYKESGLWQAGPDKVGFSTSLNPTLKVASIRAIESASGCSVIRDSIVEQGGLFVVAAVTCKASSI